jgi:hypothetical protein
MVKTGVSAELDNLGRDGIILRETGEGLVEGKESIIGIGRLKRFVIQYGWRFAATPHGGPAAASVVNQYAAHGLGRGGKEVASAFPACRVRRANEPQIGLVDKRGRVK